MGNDSMVSTASGFLTAILVMLGLGLIVILHELGHFLLAKKNGVRVEVFSVGFGRSLFRFLRGETEYRIGWLPLGGYVKLAGEGTSGGGGAQSFELRSKTPWQRFQIFVAGAVMNLIIAFPIAILAYAAGMYRQSAEVGLPGLSEARGGLLPGDEILRIGSKDVDGLDAFNIQAAEYPEGASVPVLVRRRGTTLSLSFTAGTPLHNLCAAPDLMLPSVVPGSPLARAGVGPGQEILDVDGREETSRSAVDRRLRGSPGREVRIGIGRPDTAGRVQREEFEIRMPERAWYVLPEDDRILECIVGVVLPTGAASGILRPGDLIVRAGEKSVRCWQDLREAVEPSVNRPLVLEIRRAGEIQKVTLVPGFGESGQGALGISPAPTPVFAVVAEGSYYYQRGLRSGDALRSLSGASGKVTVLGPGDGSSGIFGFRSSSPRSIRIEVERSGERSPISLDLEAKRTLEGDLAAAGFPTDSRTGRLLSVPSRFFHRAGVAEALTNGARLPFRMAGMTFSGLKRLFGGGASVKSVSGPIGIARTSYAFAKMSPGNFLWLLCLITVNLGIFNLLPVPILDGGQNLLLGIEVVRKWMGKPPPGERFVRGFNLVGLVLLVLLFVVATSNDLGGYVSDR